MDWRVKFDPAAERVFQDVLKKSLIAGNLNWIAIDSIDKPLKIKAKIRYNHKESSCKLLPLSKNQIKVSFFKPQRAITPGQSVVFYSQDTVLGGGLIKNILSFDS